jgi:predicted DNA-binding transcriptional regulator AlpA
MKWTSELEALLNAARALAQDDLPRFLGDLETVRAVAWSRLTATAPVSQKAGDELIDIEEAARRLGVSCSFLYRNHGRYAFSRRVGRLLRFSSQGIHSHIEQSGVLTPRRRSSILTPAVPKQETKTQ